MDKDMVDILYDILAEIVIKYNIPPNEFDEYVRKVMDENGLLS